MTLATCLLTWDRMNTYATDDGLGLGDVVALLVDAGVAVGVCDESVA